MSISLTSLLSGINPIVGTATQILSSTGLVHTGAAVPFTVSDVAQMFASASPEQLEWLRARWTEDSSKKGMAMPTDASTFYYYAAGGKDGKVTSDAGRHFLDQVVGLIRTQGGTLTAGVGPASGGATTLQPTAPSSPGTVSASAASSGVLGFLTQKVFGVPMWALLALAAVLVFFILRQN